MSNYRNRDWKLPLPPSYFGDLPAPLPTPPAGPRALQVVRTPTSPTALTNPTPTPPPRALELAAPSVAVEQRAALFRWTVLMILTVLNTFFTLAVLARR